MSQKSLRIYSHKDFSKADRIDRIKMHLVEPDRFTLFEHEEDYLRKLTQAYQQCFNELRQSEAVTWIQNNIHGCETWYKANRVFDDMTLVFGHFVNKNLEYRRQIVVERLYFYAAKLEEAENWEAAAKVSEKAAKLEGLDKILPDFDPDAFEFPEIEVNSNPETLRLMQADEEAEFEDED